MHRDLQDAKTIADVFRIVKQVVNKRFGTEQAGLLIGLSDWGEGQGPLVGAFYAQEANTIVINKRPLHLMQRSQYNAYLFNILLKEYLHSLGMADEPEIQRLVKEMTHKSFGASVPAAYDGIISGGTLPEAETLDIEYVNGVDRDKNTYIL